MAREALTPMQRAFCLHFTSGETMGKLRESAIKAGYTERSAHEAAYNLTVRNPRTRKLIEDHYAVAEVESGITKARVMAELGRIAFADPRNSVRWKGTRDTNREFDEETGEPAVVEIGNHVELLDSDEISGDDAAAIAEISEGQHGIKIKFHPKVPALIELGRHLGIATKIAHTGPKGSGPVEVITAEMTAEQAAEAYAATLDED